jgi:hypothetical protein
MPFFACGSWSIIGLSLAVQLLSVTGFAHEPWDKQPERWSLAETYRILQDSPWSPTKSHFQVSISRVRRVDPLTHMPSDSPSAARDTGPQVGIELGRGEPLPPVSVLWWSSKTVRLAQQRLRQLRDPSAPQTPLQAETLTDFIVIVEGNETLRILQDASEDLRQSAYLEIPGGTALDASRLEFHEGGKVGEDYVAFYFPRQIEGQPTITQHTEQVVFHCKASAKTGRPGQPGSISIRVVFEPKRMRAAGQPDL